MDPRSHAFGVERLTHSTKGEYRYPIGKLTCLRSVYKIERCIYAVGLWRSQSFAINTVNFAMKLPATLNTSLGGRTAGVAFRSAGHRGSGLDRNKGASGGVPKDGRELWGPARDADVRRWGLGGGGRPVHSVARASGLGGASLRLARLDAGPGGRRLFSCFPALAVIGRKSRNFIIKPSVLAVFERGYFPHCGKRARTPLQTGGTSVLGFRLSRSRRVARHVSRVSSLASQ